MTAGKEVEKVSWYTMPQGYLWSRAGTKPGDREAAMLQARSGVGGCRRESEYCRECGLGGAVLGSM